MPNRRNDVEAILEDLPDLQEPATSVFDSADAQAYSCYGGIVKPKKGDDPKREKTLRIVPSDRLWPKEDSELIYPQGESAHDMLRAHIIGEHFPCVGARSAFMQGTYRFGFYREMGNMSSVAPMGRDLRRFISEYDRLGRFTTFVATFQKPAGTSEEEYEALLFKHLQLLHDHDIDEWDPNYSPDPNDPHFAFSFYGCAFFVVGMHSQSSRYSRRVAFPTLIFNPESQILALKQAGIIDKMASRIRERDTLFQGSTNPSLPSDHTTTGGEARVYSGKHNPEGTEWKCPFHTRPEVLEKNKRD